MITVLPDCSTFTKEVQAKIETGDVIGERRYRLKFIQRLNQQRVDYSPLNNPDSFPYAHKWFLACELHELLKQLWNLGIVKSVDLRDARDTCQFRAMGNLLVHFGYATYHKHGGANVYRKRCDEV
jgi:hypothetical protein